MTPSWQFQQADSDLERSRLEEALHRSEEALRRTKAELEQYRILYETLPFIGFTVDLAGMVLGINQFGEARLGYTAQELIQQPIFNLVYPEDYLKLKAEFAAFAQPLIGSTSEAIAELTSNPVMNHWEFRQVCKDGSVIWLKASVKLLRKPLRLVSNNTNSVKHIKTATDLNPVIYLVCEDITEHKQVEEEFREIGAALDNAGEGISRLDEQGRYISVNRAYASMVGYQPEEMIGLGWQPTVHPEDRSQVMAAYQQMLTSGKADVEARGVRKDGSIFYKQVVMLKAYDRQQRLIGHYCFMKDITEHKQSQLLLQQKRNFISAVVDTAGCLVVVLDRAGRIVRFNRACEATTAYTFDEVRDRYFWDLFLIAEEREPVKAVFKQLQAGKFPIEFENYWVTKDGSYRLIAWSNTAIVDAKGTVEYIIATGIDITERKRAEEELRRSQQQQYQALINSINGIVWEADAQTWQFSFISPHAKQILGYPIERWLSEPNFWINHIHPEDREWAIAFCKAAIQKQRNYEIEYRMIAADGRSVWLKDVVTVMTENARPTRLRGVMIDITTHKQAEIALRESEERYRRIIETASEGIWILDADNQTTFANGRMAEMLGYTVDEMLGMSLFAFIYEEDRALTEALLKRRRQSIKEQHDFKFRRKDGSNLWAIVSATSIFDPAGQYAGALGMVTDITERKRAEEALYRSEAKNRALLSAIPDLMLCLSKDGIYLNFKAARDFETFLPSKDFLGKSQEEVLPPEVAQPAKYYLKQALSTGEVQIFEYQLWQNGNLKDYEARLVACGEDEVLVIIRDITQRKQSEEALRENSERYRSVVTAMHEGVVLQDADGQIYTCNSSAERILGLSAEQMMGRTSKDPRWQAIREDGSLFPGEMHPAMITLKTGKPCSNVVMGVHRPDGILRWILINSEPLFREHQTQPYAVVTSFSDITERKRVEENLIRIAKAVESTSDAIGMADVTGVSIYHNKAFLDLFEYTVEELNAAGGPPVLYADPDVAREVFETIGSGNSWSGEVEMRSRSGRTILVALRADAIKDDKNKLIGLIGVHTDITERKRAEQQIKASLTEKEVLLKEIHHRVKNNLQIISSLLNLQSRYIENKQVSEVFQESQNRIQSMALIHERLYQSKDLIRIDLAEYIQKLAVNLFHSYQINPNAITLEVNTDEVALSIDTAIPCGLIVNELISNSLKYAFPNNLEGTIKINLSKQNNNNFLLIVDDNGVGLPEDIDLQNIKSLGLRLVNTLVCQLKGKVEVERNKGTKFKILFRDVIVETDGDGRSKKDISS